MVDLSKIAHQKAYEKQELVLHQHWIVTLKSLIAFVIVCLLPVLGWIFISLYLPSLLAMNVVQGVLVLALSMYALMAILYLFQNYLDLHLDIWIVTNERIVAAERQSIFHYTISELRLYQVQDVKAEIHGFLGNLIGFGDVIVQTAGKQVQFTFENIPDPRDVAQKILALTDADRHFHEEKITNSKSQITNATQIGG